MVTNVQKTVTVIKPKVRNVTLSPEVVNAGQDGPVIPVHRTWMNVRRESERVTQVYIRSVSTTRDHLIVNVCTEETISHTVFVSTVRTSF